MCRLFPHQPVLQLCRHQLNALQFNYNTTYLELAQTPQVRGSALQDCPRLQMPVAGPRLSSAILTTEVTSITPSPSSLSALGISKYDSERLKTPQWRAVDHTFLWSVFTTSFLSFCLMSVYKEFWSPDTRTWILHRSWLNFRTSKCWNLSSQSVIPPPHSKCALTSVMSFFLLVDYLISHSTLKI